MKIHAPLILQSAVLKNLRPNIRKTSGRLYLYQILKIIGVYLYSEYLVIHCVCNSFRQYRVVKRNCQVEKIVNLGHKNDFMTQNQAWYFSRQFFGWDQVKEILPFLKSGLDRGQNSTLKESLDLVKLFMTYGKF